MLEKESFDLSIVVPVYGSPSLLAPLVKRIKATALSMNKNVEVILVCDRCPRNSWAVIEELVANNESLVGINLSKNFGQHYAIYCGLQKAKGDWVVVMDCDLQDQPEEIPKLYQKALEGNDIVFACRAVRNDSFFKKIGSKVFYKFLGYMTGTKQDERIANFGIYNRKVIEALLKFKEQLRFFPAQVRWLGFKTAEVDIEHASRSEGKSNYSLKKLFELGFNVTISFSDKPLYLLVKFGFVTAFLSILASIAILVSWLSGEVQVEGWTSIMLSLWFMFGVIMASVGLVGIYISKTFDETKGRPVYLIDEELQSDN